MRIEIVDQKAMQLIKGMQDLDLIKECEEPFFRVKACLKKMRRNAGTAPNPDEINKIAQEVRAER